MIIGIDARTLQDKNYSGVSEYTLQLLNSLFKIDTRNQYRLFYNSSQDISKLIPHFDFYNVTAEKFDYPNKLLNYGMLLPFGKPKIDELLGGVDLFFAPHINFLSLNIGTKLVLTIHDLSFLRYPEFFSARKNLWHKLLRIKKLAQRADAIITVSENTKLDVCELLQIPSEKVHVIYSGIDERIARVSDGTELDRIKNKYRLPDEYLLYLGTIEPRKNLLALIKAFELLKSEEKHPGLNLILAGGEGWSNASLHEYTQKSPLADQIRFIGYADKEDKNGLYTLARGFVYPSLYEGFGFPPLEALRCGTPTLTSYSSSLPEIIGAEAIIINPFDQADIKTGLEQLLKIYHPGQIKTPTWQEAALSYLELFDRLGDGRASKFPSQ